jgi:hypothetical protein
VTSDLGNHSQAALVSVRRLATRAGRRAALANAARGILPILALIVLARELAHDVESSSAQLGCCCALACNTLFAKPARKVLARSLAERCFDKPTSSGVRA